MRQRLALLALPTLMLAAFVPLVGLRAEPQAPPPQARPQDASRPLGGPDTSEAIAKIREEGMKNSQVMQTLSYLTDVIGPRLTASPGLKRANEWTRTKMSDWGLENAHLEAWGPFGRGWTLKRYSAQVTEPLCVPLIGFPKAWSPGTGGEVAGPIVHLDATDEAGLEKYKGKLKGAIVLLGSVREVKALWEEPAVRFTDKQLLDMANAPEPVTQVRRGNSPFEAKKAEPRKAEAGKDEPKKAEESVVKKVEDAAKEVVKKVEEVVKKAEEVVAKKADAPVRMQFPAGANFAAKRLQFLIDEGVAATMEPSFRGDGGTLYAMSATVPQPTPAAGGPGGMMGRASAYAKDAPKTIPQIVLAIEHFNRVLRMLQAGESLRGTVDIAVEFHDQDLMSYNTVAEIPGTDLKDEIVMLGGHLDSWHSGTGATDNGAGCAVVMEAVRILKALELKPRRTIRAALWSGEEQGLYGSRAYVAEHLAAMGGGESAAMAAMFGGPRGPITKKDEYDKFSAYFNLDNGTGKVRGIYLQGNEACRPIFRKWLAPFRDLDASTITASNTSGTDHQAFDGVGLPGFQFIQDPIEYENRTHHSNMDVFDRIQADDMKQASVIMAAFVYNAAMADEKLPRKPSPAPPGGSSAASR
ncbi:MAG: M20/M25/M40 family metallo-hydrolase [Isosphaeraceae bacterium]